MKPDHTDKLTLPEVHSHQKILCHNQCPLINGSLTSHMMTSSPRAPPPPLTLTGATLGTKRAQRKPNYPSDWTAMSKAGARHFY